MKTIKCHYSSKEVSNCCITFSINTNFSAIKVLAMKEKVCPPSSVFCEAFYSEVLCVCFDITALWCRQACPMCQVGSVDWTALSGR